jgi:hydrogenase maturation protease
MNMIVGVGNPLRRDEGVGIAAIARLNDHYHLPDGVCAVDAGTPGLALLDIVRDARAVVLIDAMTADQPPGTIYQVDPARLRSRGPEWSESLHGVSLLGTIHLAEAVGMRVPPITIVGVEPAVLDWGEGLSEPVATALDLVAAIALGLSTSDPHHPTRHRRKEVPVST